MPSPENLRRASNLRNGLASIRGGPLYQSLQQTAAELRSRVPNAVAASIKRYSSEGCASSSVADLI
jgi:hypothetical protein